MNHLALVGRSSSHFTRTARMFALELGVPHAFRPVLDLTTLDAKDIGSPRGSPPGAPTAPDVPDGGIRLFRAWVRYARPAGSRAGGSGWCCRIGPIRSQVTFAFCERRSSHVRPIFTT